MRRTWLLLQIIYGFTWRVILLTFAFIGMVEWYFAVLG